MIFGMRIGALFNYKLKRGLAGRRQSCDVVKSTLSATDRVIWMHAASLGEYEQGLPVLEELKEKFPTHKILVTFFSPSGYENVVRKGSIADAVCYLPFDIPEWIKEFTSHFQTDIFISVKYEFWYNLLAELKRQNIKTYVISALFYETQIFFKIYGKWFTKQLRETVSWFFHQTSHSTALAKGIGLRNSSTAGDTRYDRVKEIRQQNTHVDFIETFKNGQKLIVFGSSWAPEERIAELLAKAKSDLKIIIAPHDLKRVSALKEIFSNAKLYSKLSADTDARGKIQPPQNLHRTQILIIDCIGLLSKIYSYADIAVVGGGFQNTGLHNILEAANYGVPVFFGKNYKNKPEADELIKYGGGKSFEDEFYGNAFINELLKNPGRIQEMGQNAKRFIDEQPNATQIILRKILADSSIK